MFYVFQSQIVFTDTPINHTSSVCYYSEELNEYIDINMDEDVSYICKGGHHYCRKYRTTVYSCPYSSMTLNSCIAYANTYGGQVYADVQA